MQKWLFVPPWLALLCCSCQAPRAKETGLVAHYTFAEGAGPVLHDQSGARHHGKIVGATWVAGPTGAALDFDGSMNQVNCEDELDTRLRGPLTVSVWVRPFGRGTQYLTLRGPWALSIRPDGVPEFVVSAATGGVDGKWLPVQTVSAAPPIPLNKWTHLAAIYNTERQSVSLLINGNLAGSGEKNDGSIGGIFRSKLVLGQRFNGLMTDFRLYDRALSVEQIQRLCHETTPDESLAVPSCRLRLTEPLLFFSVRKIYMQAYLSPPKPTGKVSAEVSLCEPGGTKPLQTRTVEDLSLLDAAEVTFSLTSLPPGDYEVRASASAPDGSVLARISTPIRFPKTPWWYGSKVGTDDIVLPPYTPLTVLHREEGAALDIGCWGRTYVFGQCPFPQEIVTAGRSILAEPIRLVGRVDGREIRWQAGALEEGKETPTQVTMSQRLSEAALECAADVLVEYDGLIYVRCAIKPARATRIEKLVLEIPLRREHAGLCYQYRDNLSKAPGEVPREGFARPLNLAIWLGDEERGLQWFTTSDADWYPTDYDRAVEVVPDGDRVILRLNLVAVPVELSPDAKKTRTTTSQLSYSFGFQATPMKPITRDAWDHRIVSTPWYGREYAPLDEVIDGKPALDYMADKGVKTMFLTAGWTGVFGYPGCIGRSEELHRMVKACHARGIQVITYLGGLFSDPAPEYPAFLADFAWCNTKSPYSYYPFFNSMPPGRTMVSVGVCCQGSWRDFMVAGAARLMDEFDLDGLYLDGVGLGGRCYSVAHGCGDQVRPDGTPAGNITFLAGRDLIRRLYQVVKSRKPEGQVDLHPAAHWCSSTMAWATSVWDGETILGNGRTPPEMKKVALLEYLRPNMFRTEYMGKNWGVPVEFLDYEVPYSYQRQFALTLLHDTPIRPHNSREKLDFISGIWRVFDDFGRKEAEWLPYWKNSEYVSVQPGDAYVSLYRHPKNGVLAVVSNLGKEKAHVKVDFALDKLGLLKSCTAINALTQEPVPLENKGVSLDLDSVDWRLIWLKPQSSTTDGGSLGR